MATKSRDRLDSFDLQLLDLLQRDSLATADQLADHVALSPSAITRRVRRMREDGTIRADVALVSRLIADVRLSALVLVQAHEHAEARGIAALRAKLIAADEVQLLVDVAGEYDLAVLICARDMRDYNAIAERLLQEDPAVRRYETTFVKRTYKQSGLVPVRDGA